MACAAPQQGTFMAPRDAASHRTALIGIWAACQGSLVPPLPNEVGIEFSPDGGCYRLTRDDGVVQRHLGFTGAGAWSIVGATQLNLDFHFGGSVYVLPLFASTPRQMSANNSGAYSGVWARSP